MEESSIQSAFSILISTSLLFSPFENFQFRKSNVSEFSDSETKKLDENGPGMGLSSAALVPDSHNHRSSISVSLPEKSFHSLLKNVER